MRKALGLAGTVLALASAAPLRAEPRADLAGRWATEGFGSIVEFKPCAKDPTTMCGRIVWLWTPNDHDWPRTDRRNPDPTLRSRALLGIELVEGLRPAGPAAWTNGRLYNPDDGRTYGGSVRLRAGLLELQGCALTVLCRSQTWRRPQDIVAAALAP